MTKTFYLTTTLPYVNAAPHIGHALEFFQADALARYFRKKLGDKNVFFNVGTDEHGLKILQKSKEYNLSPKDYVDQNVKSWYEFCEKFKISYDYFYRTSEKYHYPRAQRFWEECFSKGDIYKKKYEGLYCVGCEAFKTDKELVNGKCPDHNIEPIFYSEENYFFKLTKYKDILLKYYDNNKNTLKPLFKLQELENFIKNIEDISISRVKENLPWGIPVPGDDTQVMYVWFDALTNYINTIGYPDDLTKFNIWWNNNDDQHQTLQIFGPDNLRFQCAIWQGMLASAGIQFTKNFICHGTILGPDGRKMSKTIGNIVSPFDQVERFGVDTVRYYMLGVMPTFGDTSYNESDLIFNYNANLSNNFGNLLNRVIHLSDKKEIVINNIEKVEAIFKKEVDDFSEQINKSFEEFDLKVVADKINNLSNRGNKYIDEKKPWMLKDIEEIQLVLNNLSYLLLKLIDSYEPFIPDSIMKARKALQERETIILFPKIEK